MNIGKFFVGNVVVFDCRVARNAHFANASKCLESNSEYDETFPLTPPLSRRKREAGAAGRTSMTYLSLSRRDREQQHSPCFVLNTLSRREREQQHSSDLGLNNLSRRERAGCQRGGVWWAVLNTLSRWERGGVRGKGQYN